LHAGRPEAPCPPASIYQQQEPLPAAAAATRNDPQINPLKLFAIGRGHPSSATAAKVQHPSVDAWE